MYSTGHLQGCGKAQKNFQYVHTCIYAITSLPFTDYFTVKVCHMGPFPAQESLLHFLYFRQEEQSFFVSLFEKVIHWTLKYLENLSNGLKTLKKHVTLS